MTIKRLQQIITKNKIDLILLMNTSLNKLDPNLFYFTGINLEFAILAIHKKKSPCLYVAEFELPRIKLSSKIKRVKALDKKEPFKQIIQDFKACKTIATNNNIISVNELRSIKKKIKKKKFKDISKQLQQLRRQKNNDELANIKKACSITDKIIKDYIKNFKKFKTEKQAQTYLKEKTEENNCELAFPPIVASGKNSAFPHHIPNNKKINKGFIIIDFGVKYKGYCSDITRTIYLGKPNKDEIENYDKILNTQIEAIKNIKPGIKCSNLYDSALKQLGPTFTHGLGHGIGINIHELPNLKPKQPKKEDEKLDEKMVFTIEPGIYIKNKYGIRIEDDIAIINKKPVVLTKTPKNLKII